MSLLPTAMPISARSFSKEDIISVTLFFWWLVISFSFCSSESMVVKQLCWRRAAHVGHKTLWRSTDHMKNPFSLNSLQTSRSALHSEPRTLWLCPQPPGSSGHSWQPAPPAPAEPPSPPPWRLHSQPAGGSARFAGCRGRGEKSLRAGWKISHAQRDVQFKKHLKFSQKLHICTIRRLLRKTSTVPAASTEHRTLSETLHSLLIALWQTTQVG